MENTVEQLIGTLRKTNIVDIPTPKHLQESESHLNFLVNLNHMAKEYVGELSHYYQSIISCLPNNIYWLDRNCILLGGNDNLAKMFGLKSSADLIGLTYDEMSRLANWTEGQAEVFRQAELKVMATGKPHFNVDEPAVIINGEKRYYMSTKVPLYNTKNEIIGVIGISTDITERKEAQEREKLAIAQAAEEKIKAQAELELRQAVSVLTGSIAHDLRTPLAAMAINWDVVKQILPTLINAYRLAKTANLPGLTEDISEKRLKLLEATGQRIQNISQEMTGFIDITLQTLSKGLKGESIEGELVSCSMWHCIHNTLSYYPYLKGQAHLVQWDKQDFSFKGNQLLMVRILSNLLANSLQQISKNQRGEIYIRTEKGENFNAIHFKDTAGGAPDEVIKNLFKGYSTTKKTGTGIGLAFCKLTMQSFGGKMDCISSEEGSIEFVLTLPKII
jgi:PAS domain S-box-containing protein